MIVRLKGIKAYRSRGKLYHYHRATGTRLRHEPGTAAFVEEVRRLDAMVAERNERPGTLGGLMAAYRASPEFRAKAESTRGDYHDVMDYLKPLADMPLARIDPPFVLKLRDRTFEKRKRRFANYVVSMLSILFNWGLPRGITTSNPTEKVPKVPRPRTEAEANRAWRDIELEVVLLAAPDELRIPIALAAFAGLRQGDVIRLPWSAYQDGVIESRQAKTGDPIWVPAHSELRAILEAAPHRADTIVVGAQGRPFTEAGFRARFFKLIRELTAKDWVRPGLTFHGLRHTAAVRLADAGCDTRDIQAVLGHRTAAMSEHYARGADRKRRAAAAIEKLEKAQSNKGAEGV